MNRLRLVVLSLRAWILRHGPFAVAVLVPLALGYRAAIRAHMERGESPYVFNDDVRQQIFPFFRYRAAGLFPHDYLGDYFRACLPIGYRAVYTIGGVLIDPARISKALPYVLLAVTVGAMAAAGRRLGGYFGALFAGAFVLSGAPFLERMAGGLPRAFAFPVLALTAAALVYGRARLLAAIVCVGAAFYPAAAMPAGIALTIWMLFLSSKRDGSDASEWSLGRRARLVAFAGVVSAALLAPTLIASRAYGRALRPADVVDYPEIGPGGRYGPGDRAPFNTFPEAALEEARHLFKPIGEPWSRKWQAWAADRTQRGANSNGDVVIEALIGIVLIGGAMAAKRDAASRRLLALGIAAWAGHLVARPVAPYFYLPQRYAAYPVPILIVLLFPAAAAAIGAAIGGRRFTWLARPALVAWVAAMVILPFAGRGTPDAGLDTDVRPRRRFYDFLRQLPKDALIAGWPSDIDNVPYVSRRQAFLTYELHQAFHKRYADEMRRRMRALLDAYFASDPAPLIRLRDEFGVTHFVFQQGRLDKAPSYFKPFDGWIRPVYDAGEAAGFELPRQVEAMKVFSDGPLIVLDLRRLDAR